MLDLHTNPLSTDYVFYPFTVDLRLHTYALFYGLLSIPLQLLLGVVGAFNLLILLTVTLNAYTIYLLGRHLWGRTSLALVAAGLVALNPALTFHLRVGRPSFAAIWPVALALIFLNRLGKTGHRRNAIGLGLTLLMALLIDFQILLYCGLWLALFGTYLLFRRPASVLNGQWVGQTVLALALVGILFLTIFYPPLAAAEVHGYPEPTARDTILYSLRAKDFMMPWFLQATFGVALPIAVVITLFTLHKCKRPAFWLAGWCMFLVLSLGVVLQPTDLPLPFAVLRRLPRLAQFRTPYRFNIPAVVGLALAAAGALTYWQDRLLPAPWRPFTTLALIGLILIDARAAASFPMQQYPDEPVYHRIAREPGDVIVLEVPVGIRSGIDVFGRGETLQFYQMIHGKRLINGVVARVPRRMFDAYRSSPSLHLLAGEPVPIGADVETDFAARLRELRVGYVIVHPSMLELAALERIETMLARRPELTLVEATSTIRIYPVK